MLQLFHAALLALAVSIVVATPVTPAKCVTVAKGTLTTSELTDPVTLDPNGQFKPFAFNFRGELSFYHRTPHPKIYAEFQTCKPNYAKNNNKETGKSGRIYIPSTKKCLAVSNPDSKTGPYYVVAKGCPNSSAGEMSTAKSIPFNWSIAKGYIGWDGAALIDGSRLQGNCPGGWGFRDDERTRIPITGKSGEYRVELVCIFDGSAGVFWLHP